MNKTLLAIDIGTHIGWAVLDEHGQRVASGQEDLKAKKEQTNLERIGKSRELFKDLLGTYKPDVVAYESVKRWLSSTSAFLYNNFLAQLLLECRECGLPTHGYAPTAIKKAATGRGRADKTEMIAAALRIYNHQCEYDDEADALCIGFTAHKLLSP